MNDFRPKKLKKKNTMKDPIQYHKDIICIYIKREAYFDTLRMYIKLELHAFCINRKIKLEIRIKLKKVFFALEVSHIYNFTNK